MKFSKPMVRGILVKRYKRFLADVRIESGEEITAHCANTGKMTSCGSPGDTVILSYNQSPKRKLAYSWELTETAGGYIGVNTMRPNQVVEEALQNRNIAELLEYDQVSREVTWQPGSRLDFKLSRQGGPDCFVEVKNVTLKIDADGYFPDTVTVRGTKHLETLMAIQAKGLRAVLFFLVNRPDVRQVEIASHIDPTYGATFIEAVNAGVEIICYQAKADVTSIAIGSQVRLNYP